MDTLEKVFNEMYDNSVNFVDFCLNGNKDFKKLDESVQAICRALCISLLITYRWMDFCHKVNKE